MTLRTQAGGTLFGDAPLVRSMTGGAFITQSLDMNRMLTAFHGSLVAFRTGGAGFCFRIVNLMAVVTLKRLMCPRHARWLGQR